MSDYYRKSGTRRGLLSVIAIFGGWLFAIQVQAACTAGNPNVLTVEDTPTTDFTNNGDGTVTHGLTGLMWKQCAEGLSGTDCLTGTAATMSWSSALQSASSDTTAGYSDWRLPNQRELISILETCGYAPAINQVIFPNTPLASYFWSASSSVAAPSYALHVYFYEGGSNEAIKTATYNVRLVRSGQSLDTFDALSPQLSALSVSGTSATDTTLTATSNIDATGYWLLVAQGSVAPTSTEVKAGTNYGAVTVVSSGNGAMSAGMAIDFNITGMDAEANYELYLVAYEVNNNLLSLPSSLTLATNTTVDVDGDGVPNDNDAFPFDASESVDTDGDGIGDNADDDDDGDGVTDRLDDYPLDATRSSNAADGGTFGLWFLFGLIGTTLLCRRARIQLTE